MSELVLGNATIVTADAAFKGAIKVLNGTISDISLGPTGAPHEDCEDGILIPGLVELHTDHLESHYRPRPGVTWPPVEALLAHDAQIAAAGITTVFDALRAGTFETGSDATHLASKELGATVRACRSASMLRADHRIHLRCELPCPDTVEVVEEFLARIEVGILSVMDHTPGERQYVELEKFRRYFLGKRIMDPNDLERFIEERIEMNVRHSASNRRSIVVLAHEHAIPLASHDDATEAHVREAVEDRVAIAEFPTTAASSRAAHEAGLTVLMGAPNLVRGGSHSGNISTADVASAGHLEAMSSDYVPSSLLQAAFALAERDRLMPLPEAIRTVSLNPARAAGLQDRGEIALGKRADLVLVKPMGEHRIVTRVWRGGERVV